MGFMIMSMFRQRLQRCAVGIQSFVLLRIKLTYIISKSRVAATRRRNPAAWRKRLYITMSHNAASASDYHHLPVARTQELDTLILSR